MEDTGTRFILNDFHLFPTRGNARINRIFNNDKRYYCWSNLREEVSTNKFNTWTVNVQVSNNLYHYQQSVWKIVFTFCYIFLIWHNSSFIINYIVIITKNAYSAGRSVAVSENVFRLSSQEIYKKILSDS